MIRTQQLNQANESKSTFERRPSQRFTSRRSRMDRTRPNITSSSSLASTAGTRYVACPVNNNKTSNCTDRQAPSSTSASDQTNPMPTKAGQASSNQARAMAESKNKILSNEKLDNTENQQLQQMQNSTKPANIVINSVTSRQQLLHSKPVKPPTVPPSVSYNSIQAQQQQQIKSQTMTTTQSNHPSNTTNQNILHHHRNQSSDLERLSNVTGSFDGPESLGSSNGGNRAYNPTPSATTATITDLNNHDFLSQIQANNNFNNNNSLTKPHTKLSSQNHHAYVNYKAPDAQPPPPPPPKNFDKGFRELSQQHPHPLTASRLASSQAQEEPLEISLRRVVRISSVSDLHSEPGGVTSAVPTSTQQTHSIPPSHNYRSPQPSSNHHFQQQNHQQQSINQRAIQQGEIISSSSMPPPPPPPPQKHLHSNSSQLLNQTNQSINNSGKPQHHHSSGGLTKPICVTEL